jgi:multicomponent Na+:H+ antiporter subunit E
MRTVLRIAFLTAIWTLAWGSLTVANVASGILVSGVLLLVYPIERGATGNRWLIRPRPLAMVKLIGFIVADLIVSNALISREIVTRRSRIRTGIVACRLRTNSEQITTFLAAVLALVPGTIPVKLEADPSVIYVHVLHLYDVEKVRRSVARLEAMTVRAIGTPEMLALIPERTRR